MRDSYVNPINQTVGLGFKLGNISTGVLLHLYPALPLGGFRFTVGNLPFCLLILLGTAHPSAVKKSKKNPCERWAAGNQPDITKPPPPPGVLGFTVLKLSFCLLTRMRSAQPFMGKNFEKNKPAKKRQKGLHVPFSCINDPPPLEDLGLH